VTFRVWAPHASSVSVIGEFNNWSPTASPMRRQAGGNWIADLASARVGQQYRYLITTNGQAYSRRDPYGRLCTSSDYAEGNTIIYDPGAFDWEGETFTNPPVEDLVIYEMHVGTFNDSNPNGCATLADAVARLDHVVDLGATAVEVLPVNESLGVCITGYGPADLFAVDNIAYGGPDGFKQFVRACHERGLAVILDVVYNHWGPWDLHLSQFDGWSDSTYTAGIYFYDTTRLNSPFGPRPNYDKPQVRQFIFNNLRMWIEEYHVDGFRWDSTLNIDNTNSGLGEPIPAGKTLMQQANSVMHRVYPGKIAIAEDLRDDARLTQPVAQGGHGFDSQWHYFAAPVRSALTKGVDANRNMNSVADALAAVYNADPFQRIIFSESHNEICCGNQRLTVEIDRANPNSWTARKRSTIGAALTFTAAGIPMIYQGQEFLDQQPFDQKKPIDWNQLERYPGVYALYRDLVALRGNALGHTAGLRGAGTAVHHVDNTAKVIAYHRFDAGGPGDDCVIVANFSGAVVSNYAVGFPQPGDWMTRLNSDDPKYGADYSGVGSVSVAADGEGRDGMAQSGLVTIAPYSVLILSQDR